MFSIFFGGGRLRGELSSVVTGGTKRSPQPDKPRRPWRWGSGWNVSCQLLVPWHMSPSFLPIQIAMGVVQVLEATMGSGSDQLPNLFPAVTAIERHRTCGIFPSLRVFDIGSSYPPWDISPNPLVNHLLCKKGWFLGQMTPLWPSGTHGTTRGSAEPLTARSPEVRQLFDPELSSFMYLVHCPVPWQWRPVDVSTWEERPRVF